MKGIKPFKLGMMTRPFQWGASHHLGITVTGYFPFEPAGSLYGDMELWMSIADLLGDQPILDVGIPKSRSEFLVVGDAFQPGGLPATTCPVRVKVGALEKKLHAIGDRVWRRGVPTEPQRFARMPLSWDRAFGGEGFERNPLGRGFAPVTAEDGTTVHPLPNVEPPGKLVTSPKDRPEPAGFGPVDFTWPQRMKLAGTYDKRWLDTRFPGFAEDMDWRIWNMAAADQHQDGPFRGDETLFFENMHPTKPRLTAHLPNIRARSFVTKRDAAGAETFQEIPLGLTTLWLFPNAEVGVLVFQGATPVLEDDATDVLHLMIAGERLSEPRDMDHYRAVLEKRLDPANAAEVLNDDDLMPPGLTGLGPQIERVTEMTAPEGLRGQRMRQRADKEIAESRAHIASLGLDPDEHGAQPLPPEEAPPSLVELPQYIAHKMAELEEIKAQGVADRALRDAETEAFFNEVGLDYDVIRAEKTDVPAGPPRFSADEHRDMFRRMADDAAAAGYPQDELEFYASDPGYYAQLQENEAKSIEGYRLGAHLQPAAAMRTGDDSLAVREDIERRFRAGERFDECDFTGVDLSSMDFEGASFRRALLESVSFENANLSGANFEGAVLAHANLSGAKIYKTCFHDTNLGKAKLLCVDSRGEVDMTGAVLWGSDLTGASLVGATLTGATLLDANLRAVDLSRANLDGVFFHQVPMTGATMVGATARLAIFMEVDAKGIDFGGAMLEEAVFLKCDADGAKFMNAQMTNVRLVESTARKADFRGAVLAKANLRGAELSGADLSGAQLGSADLSEAKLEGARLYRILAPESFWIRTDLRNAFLVSADMRGVILQKADIRGADLRGANLYGADFALVHSDTRTTVEGAIQLKVKHKPTRPTS